jgi:hypothetical protein
MDTEDSMDDLGNHDLERRKYMFILHDVPRGKPNYGRQFG